MLMFGGVGEKGGLNDLWVYETVGDRWTEIVTPVAPPLLPGSGGTGTSAGSPGSSAARR